MRSTGLIVLLLIGGGVARAADDPVKAIALGDEHTCALRRSGTVSCWGRNFSGQLGDGTREDRGEPTAVAGLNGVQQLVAYGARTCAVRTDGALLCWGRTEGVAGQADPRAPWSWDSTTPKLIQGIGGVAEVAIGAEHICARDHKGAVRCWGKNDHGQVGDGSKAARGVPTKVAGLPAAKALALGTSHSCALVDDGTVWCWGANEGGQLGDGTLRDRARATPIKDFYGTVQIVASGASSCARLANGTARCWGWNSEGQLGDGTRQPHAIPKQVRGLEGAVDLALGATTACARRMDSRLLCWGDEALPASSSEDHNRSLNPVEQKQIGPVNVLARAGQIAAGHQCVVERGAVVRCWGKNDHGQLGGLSDGTPTKVRVVPQPVFGAR
jgi:alpha-tubulin suppressor-like RCC1 family protein